MTDDQTPQYPWFSSKSAELRAQGGAANEALAASLEALGRHFEHGALGSCEKCLPFTAGWIEKTVVRPGEEP